MWLSSKAQGFSTKLRKTGHTEPSNISCGALKFPKSQGSKIWKSTLENAGNTFASPSFSRRKIPLPHPKDCVFLGVCQTRYSVAKDKLNQWCWCWYTAFTSKYCTDVILGRANGSSKVSQKTKVYNGPWILADSLQKARREAKNKWFLKWTQTPYWTGFPMMDW